MMLIVRAEREHVHETTESCYINKSVVKGCIISPLKLKFLSEMNLLFRYLAWTTA